jgi:hypothetical protein
MNIILAINIIMTDQIENILENINSRIDEINIGPIEFSYTNILEFIKSEYNDNTSVKSILSESPLDPKDKILSNEQIDNLDDGYESDDETMSELIQVEPIKLGSDFYDIDMTNTISELNDAISNAENILSEFK